MAARNPLHLYLLAFAAILSLAAIVTAAGTAQVKENACSIDALPALPDVRLVAVTSETEPEPHCKVEGVIGTETRFSLQLPEAWNGKFVMGGGAGFGGVVFNSALPYGALEKGYATVGTDTGHAGHPLDASWALNNLERIVSFGHKAVHRTAVTAKALVAAYYGQEISQSYFMGCSRGGGQALMEAQRYPEDFTGIVAGAPAYNWTVELGARNTLLNQAMYPDPNNLSLATITPGAQHLIGEAVMARCDKLDGLKDGIINDPTACKFDVSKLACRGGETGQCLSPEQVKAARTIYGDVSIDGEGVFPGFPVGGELGPGGWTRWLTGGLDVAKEQDLPQEVLVGVSAEMVPVAPNDAFAVGNSVMKYLVYHDPDWTYAGYSFDSFTADTAAAAESLNATDPDLSAFLKHGGKLLMYSGWADMAVSPLGTIAYYESVLDRDPSAAKDARLFMLPGVDHCYGGAGPDFVDFLDEIDSWVESGKAPDRLIAYWKQDGSTGGRPICAYPQVLTYKGEGDPRAPASFTCEAR